METVLIEESLYYNHATLLKIALSFYCTHLEIMQCWHYFLSLCIKKCPLEFTKNIFMKIHPRRGILVDKNVYENSPKVSTRIHPLKMSTRIRPFWKKVSTRNHFPQEFSIPEIRLHIPYARHYKPRLVFFLAHFSLRLKF
jgi:hypothetical protein